MTEFQRRLFAFQERLVQAQLTASNVTLEGSGLSAEEEAALAAKLGEFQTVSEQVKGLINKAIAKF